MQKRNHLDYMLFPLTFQERRSGQLFPEHHRRK